MGHVDAYGKVRPPFMPNEAYRLTLCGKLDALDLIHNCIFEPARAG
jgi:hypothetical protein